MRQEGKERKGRGRVRESVREREKEREKERERERKRGRRRRGNDKGQVRKTTMIKTIENKGVQCEGKRR